MNIHVDKIKKLLRLARAEGATPAEASLALSRALDLIQHHNIDIAALNLDGDDERFVQEQIEIGWRRSLAKDHAIRILINYFNVRCVLTKPYVAVMGTESDVAIATYVFNFILGACARATAEWAKVERAARRKTTGQKRLAFQQGWFWGLRAGLPKRNEGTPEELQDQSPAAIMLADRSARLRAFEAEQFPDTEECPDLKAPRNHRTAAHSGFIAGRSTTIHKPLAGSANAQLQLE